VNTDRVEVDPPADDQAVRVWRWPWGTMPPRQCDIAQLAPDDIRHPPASAGTEYVLIGSPTAEAAYPEELPGDRIRVVCWFCLPTAMHIALTEWQSATIDRPDSPGDPQ
jgi:hypothetical protein